MEYSNPMRKPRIEKIVVNIGVGESGEKLVKAEKLLEELTKCKPVRTVSRHKIPSWNIKKGDPIGCKVTLRRERAEEFLERALEAKENSIRESCFDDNGNISFGITEYIDLPGTKYDPDIGVFGMNISIRMERPGFRVRWRRFRKSKIPINNLIKREESIEFMREKFGIQISKE